MNLKKLTIYFVSVFLLAIGCSDDNPLSTEVTQVANLYSPSDGHDAVLNPNGNLTFEWEAAKAEDGGMVMYEVAFDVAGGDFSNPVYRLPSNNNGVENRVTVPHAMLNSAAAQAGLGSSERGTLVWTVITSRGVNEKVSPQSRTIHITRLAGFANPPNRVFLTGDGSEAGSDLQNAMEMKTVGDGQFEIYAELSAGGSFSFVSSTDEDAREFVIDNGSLLESSNAPSVSQDGVYRMYLDFSIGNSALTRIDAVEFWHSSHNDVMYDFEYQGNGVFLADGVGFESFQHGWGLDSRYKFRLAVHSDGEDSYEWFGSSNADNPDPNDATPETFWHLFPVDDSQWDYTFKMNPVMHESIIDIRVVFSAEAEDYYHEVVKIADQ